MPDYDPKSIPILDDIIDDDNNDAEQINSDITEGESGLNEIGVDDDDLDLFAAETADIDIAEISEINITSMEIEVETAEPKIADIDRFIDTTEGNSDDLGEADIDRQHENIQYETVPLVEPRQEEQPAYTPAVDVGIVEDISSDNMAAEPVQPVVLKAIVNDVVKQLMPDLEQQLRLLVLQALEEKLPAEIIAQFSADNDD
jgi:hypothetical protein